MNTKINVAEILKHRPQGTKLFDWARNLTVCLDTISSTDGETVIWCTRQEDNVTTHFSYSEFGSMRGYPDGFTFLVPSPSIHDWSTFCSDGDVMFVEGLHTDYIFLKKGDGLDSQATLYHAFLQTTNGKIVFQSSEFIITDSPAQYGLRHATKEEKGRFFRALRESGWTFNAEKHVLEFADAPEEPQFKDGENPETKTIEDLPKKHELKPFDKVLVRDSKDERWRPAFFASFDEHCIHDYAYGLVGDPEGVFCKYCIPYEGNESLIGTTRNPRHK